MFSLVSLLQTQNIVFFLKTLKASKPPQSEQTPSTPFTITFQDDNPQDPNIEALSSLIKEV